MPTTTFAVVTAKERIFKTDTTMTKDELYLISVALTRLAYTSKKVHQWMGANSDGRFDKPIGYALDGAKKEAQELITLIDKTQNHEP